jgi:hypothetical protein
MEGTSTPGLFGLFSGGWVVWGLDRLGKILCRQIKEQAMTRNRQRQKDGQRQVLKMAGKSSTFPPIACRKGGLERKL